MVEEVDVEDLILFRMFKLKGTVFIEPFLDDKQLFSTVSVDI